MKNAEDNHVAEIRARDETITRYYNELEKVKHNGISAEKEDELNRQIDELKSENSSLKRDGASKTLKLQKLTRDFDTLTKKSKSERDNIEKEYEIEKNKLIKEYENRINQLENSDRHTQELNNVLQQAELEKKLELQKLEREKNKEIKDYQEKINELEKRLKDRELDYKQQVEIEKKVYYLFLYVFFIESIIFTSKGISR